MARRRMIARGAGSVSGIIATVVVGMLAIASSQEKEIKETYKNNPGRKPDVVNGKYYSPEQKDSDEYRKDRHEDIIKEQMEAEKEKNLTITFLFVFGIITLILGGIWGWY